MRTLEKIKHTLTSLDLVSKGLNNIQQVDVYRGQYQNPEDFEVMVLPAVYLSREIDHKENEMSLTTHVVLSRQDNTESFATDDQYLKEIKEALHHLESDTNGKLTLVSENTEATYPMLSVYLLNYEASYYEVSERP